MKSVMHSYSLTETHIMRVKMMAEDTGLSEGLIVRNAIDLLQEHYGRMYPVARGHLFAEPIMPFDHITRISDLIGD